MSFTFPGARFTESGTQPVDLSALIQNIGVWAENENLGIAGTPTYKAINESSAYFLFLKQQKRNFNDQLSQEFRTNPDSPKFQDLRKYMIILSNIILREYCDLDIGACELNYQTICNYNNKNQDLRNMVSGWAKEIDENNADHLTEIYVRIKNIKYPIAFFSTDSAGLRVYPFNTINPVVSRVLMGWDDNKKEYTMQALLEALDARPMSDRALYAALDDPDSGLNLNNLLSAFSSWLAAKRPGVRTEALTAYPMIYSQIPIDETNTQLEQLPIPKMPVIGDIKDDLFSEQLLIIKSNTNVLNNEYGLCKVDNKGIGIQEEGAPEHAVIPPLSPKLISRIHRPGDGNTLEFDSCTVLKSAGKYNVTIYLLINGGRVPFPHTYEAGDVKKCDNFPLISVLTRTKEETTPARLYRANYPSNVQTTSVYLDGSNIDFGRSSDPFELQFDTNVSVNQGQFSYFSVSYHDAVAGQSFYCGYLFFAQNGVNSLFSRAAAASSTTVIIDEANNIAQIAVLDTENMNHVNSYNVYKVYSVRELSAESKRTEYR